IAAELHEGGGEAGEGRMQGARAVGHGPGVGGLETGKERGREERGRRNAEGGTDVPSPARSTRRSTRRTPACSAFRLPRSAWPHAPTPAGSATRLPITSAITRISRIS